MHWLARTARILLVQITPTLLLQPPFAAQVPNPPIVLAQLVREVVYNELNDHQTHGYWRYWIERQAEGESRIEEQVETAEGPVSRLNQANGQPISNQRRRAEESRIDHLLHSASEQLQLRRDSQQDEQRIGRILSLLPNAYLYHDQGIENGCRRFAFHPDPAYPARSVEQRVFHAMSGTIWIDARLKRLVRLDGQVAQNLDFGYGLLARLDKGGWFRLERRQVSPTDWKTERLEIHMTGRALMLKSFTRETSERRGGFTPVPASISLAQGAALLDSVESVSLRPARPGLPLPR